MTNVVLITIDSLRWDYLQRVTTPAIDRLCAGGVTFQTAFSNGPRTAMSFISIMSSDYPLMYGGNGLTNAPYALAELLAEEGHYTIGFPNNALLSREFGYGRGFDDFFELELNRLKNILLGIKGIRRLTKFIAYTLDNHGIYEKGEDVTRKAIQWMYKNVASPFFLWIHYMDTHHPHVTGRDMLRRVKASWRDNKGRGTPFLGRLSHNEIHAITEEYAKEIRYVDQCIGYLLSHLFRKYGDDTLIVLTSDHGEEFMEHGNIGHSYPKLFDEMVRVPLILFGPNLKRERVYGQVSLIDLVPTILDILGVPIPQGVRGKTLLPTMEGSEPGSEKIIMETGEGHHIPAQYPRRHALRTLRWKYIVRQVKGTIFSEELYDLENDPRERVNVLEKRSSIAEQARNYMQRHIEEEERGTPLDTHGPKRDIEERLRLLGYI